ncbi:MAG: zinc ribbon domain-containing protein [Betaproteobacteria bacterium]
MHADLERLIALQKIDLAVAEARRQLAAEPDRQQALDGRLEAARQAVAGAKARLTENQNVRRQLEKDVAVHQGRLSKFREQAMAVKTNQEYHAMQKEIGFAQDEVKTIEDRMLERMLEGDELAAEVKRAEAELAKEQKAIDAERRALANEIGELGARIERLTADRATLVSGIHPAVLATFELVAGRRNGLAVAEAREGHCTICHVRLRPQVFNTIRRNEDIVQCDSCQRIMYFSPAPAAAEDVASSSK